MDGAAGSASETPSGGLRLPIFSDAIRWIISAEGGSRLVKDTGGLTKWGISENAHPNVDIEHLTREQAEEIYFESYWRPLRGNALPPALALVLFDTAVNMGVASAVRLLQTVLRRVRVDGVMGPETLAAAKMFLPRAELVAQVLELRLRWYDDLAAKSPSKYAAYLYGWRLRVFRLALEAGLWRSM